VRLEQRRQRQLKLVSVPAGYGQSTLVSWGFIFTDQSLIPYIDHTHSSSLHGHPDSHLDAAFDEIH